MTKRRDKDNSKYHQLIKSFKKNDYNYTYDPVAEALYISTYDLLKYDKPILSAKQLANSENINLDFDKDNNILGMEILLDDTTLQIDQIRKLLSLHKYVNKFNLIIKSIA